MSTIDPTGLDILNAIREIRVAMLEQRGDWAERWSRMNERLDRMHRDLSSIEKKVDTLIDAVADFRTEYNNHSHEED